MFHRKKFFLLTGFLAFFLLLFLTCKKEYSYEAHHAKGSLTDDSTGDCFPKKVAGNYDINLTLGDSNYIQVEVRVDQPGTYSIYTDTVNGYYFHTSGSFFSTGLTTIHLTGNGTPLKKGIDNFTVFFDSSSCNFSIPISDTNTAVPVSQYSFYGDSCMADSLLGFYIKGIPVSDTARLSFPADVKSPGSYSIYTDTVNGYSFSAKGTFVTTGKQDVILHCFGAPQNVGTDVFKVTADSAMCYFSVPVLSPVIPKLNDHFPLLSGSYWTYNDIHNLNSHNTIKVDNTFAVNGNIYKVFINENENNQQVISYYRKKGTEYYEYCSADKYTNAVSFATPVLNDILFLKETLLTGDSWTSDIYNGKTSSGEKKSIKYNFKCVNNNSYKVINGTAFSNVYIITMFPMIQSLTGDYVLTGEETDIYYARGVGIIFQQNIFNDAAAKTIQLQTWYIN